MKFDALGEYDENAVPFEFNYPLKLDTSNQAIACDSGRIIANYAMGNGSVSVGQSRRRAEFAVRLANREIAMDQGVVLKKVSEQWQDGRLMVAYEPMSKETVINVPESNGHADVEPEQKKKKIGRAS